MKWINSMLMAAVVAIGLSGCGGGGGSSGCSVFSSSASGASGSCSGSSSAATALVVTVSSNVIPDTATGVTNVTVTAVDSNRNVVAGAPITMSVNAGAVLTPSGTTTGSNGTVTATISSGADRSNRQVSLTVTSGSISAAPVTLQVSGANVTSTVSPGLTLQVSQSASVTFHVTDSAQAAMANQSVVVTGDGLATVTGVTNSSGDYTYSFTAPATAGALNINATAAGQAYSLSFQVQTASGPPSVTPGSVASASVAVTPSVVSTNQSGNTGNQAQVRALFSGLNNERIANVRVRFDLDNDPNSIGGSLVSGSNLVYSDTGGIASTNYIPGSLSSPTNGVFIRACWDYADFAAGTCPHSAVGTLTVAQSALRVSIGTDATVGTSDTLNYTKDFTIMVVDAAGQPAPNVPVSAVLDLLDYYKGSYTVVGSAWSLTTVSPACTNEDVNRNGILDAGEDVNGDGILEPFGVSLQTLSSTTDANGLVTLRIRYARSFATWIDYQIRVTAAVAGTEGHAFYTGTLPALATDISTTTSSPPFQNSPFGRSTSCTNPN